jgi:hypothetical protein
MPDCLLMSSWFLFTFSLYVVMLFLLMTVFQLIIFDQIVGLILVPPFFLISIFTHFQSLAGIFLQQQFHSLMIC